MIKEIRNRIHEIIEVAPEGDIPSRIFDVFIVFLIILNVLAVIFGSVKNIEVKYFAFLWKFEVLSIVIFTIEYLLRLWSCVEDEKYKRPIAGRIKYAFSFIALVDLMAILPFFIPMLIPFDLRFLRILRLFRVLRMFKMARYSESLNLIINVLKDKREQLYVTIFTASILLIIISSLIYFAEHESRPEVFSSIPTAIWCGVASMTPLGYGNLYPVTIWGRIFAALSAIIGIGLFALPAGILASGFAEQIRKRHEKVKKCPHCGKEII